MKKIKIALLVFGVVFLLNGCATLGSPGSIPKKFLVAPDPNNLFQGTWIYVDKVFSNGEFSYGNSIAVINGSSITYYFIQGSLWKEGGSSTFDTARYPYRIGEDDDTLLAMNGPIVISRYKRYKF